MDPAQADPAQAGSSWLIGDRSRNGGSALGPRSVRPRLAPKGKLLCRVQKGDFLSEEYAQWGTGKGAGCCPFGL